MSDIYKVCSVSSLNGYFRYSRVSSQKVYCISYIITRANNACVSVSVRESGCNCVFKFYLKNDFNDFHKIFNFTILGQENTTGLGHTFEKV